MKTEGVIVMLQDFEPMSAETMHREARGAWNTRGDPPLAWWLLQEQAKDDAERLKAVGNMVYPAMGRLALHIMAHSMRGAC